MNDKTLLLISLSIGLIGIICLVIILFNSDLKEINISEARELEEGTNTKISGTINRITTKEGFTIIDLEKKEIITAILFDEINLSKGGKVELEGEIGEYKGEKELIISSIKSIS